MNQRSLSISLLMLLAFMVDPEPAAASMKMEQMIRECFIPVDAPQDQQLKKVACMSYVFDAFKMFVMMQNIRNQGDPKDKGICLPPGGLTGLQILRDMRSAVKRSPGNIKAEVKVVLMYAMLEAYACVDSPTR